MPFIGLSPFLQSINYLKKKERRRVNALYRAFSISTIVFILMLMIHIIYVSMPFIGLSPFLLEMHDVGYNFMDVSMPFIGLSPFLHSPLGTP